LPANSVTKAELPCIFQFPAIRGLHMLFLRWRAKGAKWYRLG
jgi:hypothetical protein